MMYRGGPERPAPNPNLVLAVRAAGVAMLLGGDVLLYNLFTDFGMQPRDALITTGAVDGIALLTAFSAVRRRRGTNRPQ